MKNTAVKNSYIAFLFLLAPVLLGGCAKLENMFTDKDGKPLTGERISILQLQKELVPNPALQATPIVLPEPWENKFWPQPGGYPNHVMGHLTLGKDLKKVWSTSIGAGGGRREPLITQPIVAEGSVFTIDTDGEVSAFALSDGKKKWHVSSIAKDAEDTGSIGGGIAYSTGKLFVTNGYKELVCLNPADGKVLWRAATPSPARSAPTVLDDKAYVITLDNRLMVYATADGMPLWNYAGVAETTNLLGSVSPAVDASVIILPLSSGEILALRVENGQVVWEDNLSTVHRVGDLSSIADIRGQPVIDRGLVYAASYSGRMVAIDEVSGQRVWQREIGSAETPWAASATVFVISSDQQLVALTREAGDILWVTPLPRYEGSDKDKIVVWTGPVLAGEKLIMASSDGQMIEADPASGRILKTSSLPGDVTIPPAVADNTLLFLTRDGKLVAYR